MRGAAAGTPCHPPLPSPVGPSRPQRGPGVQPVPPSSSPPSPDPVPPVLDLFAPLHSPPPQRSWICAPPPPFLSFLPRLLIASLGSVRGPGLPFSAPVPSPHAALTAPSKNQLPPPTHTTSLVYPGQSPRTNEIDL
ncbi:pollen-specific leucine-rich repeat extensin-like protein 3 [Sarcophilus harrisii]|uniref:pollen-specific leucine-rich repeat extensin-like protein 3 n=1 Tax=Sarcophilus harrisii TaxID=9305 RepID=UPI001301B669|nr:pollen-specific leucine-rich repeat extensin-like protein 3 [Sarcophilus harrisii]